MVVVGDVQLQLYGTVKKSQSRRWHGGKSRIDKLQELHGGAGAVGYHVNIGDRIRPNPVP